MSTQKSLKCTLCIVFTVNNARRPIVIYTVNIHTPAITLLPVLLPLLQNPTGVTGLVVCLTVYMCRVMFNICKAQCNVRSRKEPVALG